MVVVVVVVVMVKVVVVVTSTDEESIYKDIRSLSHSLPCLPLLWVPFPTLIFFEVVFFFFLPKLMCKEV